LGLKLVQGTKFLAVEESSRSLSVFDQCHLKGVKKNVQRREFNLATIEVANNRDMSGRATADRMNRGLRTGNGRSLWRIACSTFLWSLMVAGLFFTLTPMPGRADDKDRHGDNDKGIRAEITALQATVSALQDQVNRLQTANTDLQNEITALQSQLATVQSNHALLLGPFVSVDPNPEIGVIGPNIIFSGANIHIVSGSGATNDNGNPRALGNLIIGYDEAPSAARPPLSPGDRSGSHNLVIGAAHRFTQFAFGGLVAGEVNTINNIGATVTGGHDNKASGFEASVSGGQFNTASGEVASVSGGHSNTASGFFATVCGGQVNAATGASTVCGGTSNTAAGIGTVVIGGNNVSDATNNSIAPQPPFP
jgi:hypothetical protein